MKKVIPILDSYPQLARTARVRYCALVSRDRDNPRKRTALNGRGCQTLELRGSEAIGTITTVQKDTLLWIEHDFSESEE